MTKVATSKERVTAGTTVKPVQKGDSKFCTGFTVVPAVFKANYRLMQVKGTAECSKRSILQYFCPSLSYDLSLRSLFCLFFEWRFYKVLLYI